MADAETYTCPVCGRDDIGATLSGALRSHKHAGSKCEGSGDAVTQLPPEAPECSAHSESGVTPPEPANSATCSSTSDTGDLPPETPRRTTDTRTTPTTGNPYRAVPNDEPDQRTVETIPGVDTYVGELKEADDKRSELAAQQLAAYKAQASLYGFRRPAPVEVEQPPLFDRPARPSPPRSKGEIRPMSARGLEVASRLKEMFHAYSNRMERSQQPTLGPSEIGTPCDRRIAMSLMRLTPVNPGGDNWASFVGTCIHSGLENMFLWADAGSGRYAPEVRLTFPNKHVPGGTTDLIDRMLLMVADHKAMGDYSANKLRTEGPSRTYRVQAHTYGYGASLRGEKIKAVAIVSWPRTGSSLDDLYVWDEDYDPGIARRALQRVDEIGAKLGPMEPDGEWSAPRPEDFPIDNSDCKYCPFYMRGAARSEGGVCNGRE